MGVAGEVLDMAAEVASALSGDPHVANGARDHPLKGRKIRTLEAPLSAHKCR